MTDILNLHLDRSLFDYQLEPVPDKSILITGGTTGSGRATALLLASQGSRMMIFGRHQDDLDEPGAMGTDMQSQYSPEEQRQKIDKLEMLRAEDIAACVLYVLTQPKHCDVVELQIRPHLQSI